MPAKTKPGSRSHVVWRVGCLWYTNLSTSPCGSICITKDPLGTFRHNMALNYDSFWQRFHDKKWSSTTPKLPWLVGSRRKTRQLAGSPSLGAGQSHNTKPGGAVSASHHSFDPCLSRQISWCKWCFLGYQFWIVQTLERKYSTALNAEQRCWGHNLPSFLFAMVMNQHACLKTNHKICALNHWLLQLGLLPS